MKLALIGMLAFAAIAACSVKEQSQVAGAASSYASSQMNQAEHDSIMQARTDQEVKRLLDEANKNLAISQGLSN